MDGYTTLEAEMKSIRLENRTLKPIWRFKECFLKSQFAWLNINTVQNKKEKKSLFLGWK